MAALSGWVSIRRFLGVPLMKSLPLKTPTTRRLYEEKRHARQQLQARNGTTIGIDPASVDNTLGCNKNHTGGTMDTSFRLLLDYWPYLAPLSIAVALVLFYQVRHSSSRRVREMLMEREEFLRMRMARDQGKESDATSPVRQLLQREDVSLRVLEEVYELPRYATQRHWGSPDSIRLRILESIQSELREFLRSAIQSAEFPQIRDRTLMLLDQITKEKESLQHKEPFNDIQDPEKSLLIDIFQEIEPGHTIARQKTHQLANIIKLKHQDIS